MIRMSSLVNAALSIIADNRLKYGDNLDNLPFMLKNKLTKLLCRRGRIDKNLLKFCITSNISGLDLTCCLVDDQCLRMIASVCKQLLTINLNAVRGDREDVTPTGVIALAQGCRQLQTVFLRNCILLNDRAIMTVAKLCIKISKINIQGTQITDKTLGALANLPLESVNFSYCQVTDCGVRFLCRGRAARVLVDVDMSQCTELTDDAVQLVAHCCPSVQTLIFHGCSKMTDASRAILDQLYQASFVKQLTWTIY